MRRFKVSLSTNGLQAFIRELEAMKVEVEEKEARFMTELAKIVADSLTESYSGKPVDVTTEQFVDGDKRGYIVRASGEALGFIEFGTGVYAGYGDPEFADIMPFDVYPGSWSEKHEAKRWEKWLADGKDPYRFPYNRYPTNALPKAYNALVANAHALAREIFGEGH